MFVKPWTVEISMDRTEGPLFEVACHEGNYGMFNILSGHRAEEKAQARVTTNATKFTQSCPTVRNGRRARSSKSAFDQHVARTC